MRKIKLLPALLLAVLFSSTPLRAQDKIEIFGGFSYVRVPVQIFGNLPIGGPIIVIPPGACPFPGCPPGLGGSTDHVNTHGWEFSGAFKPTDWLGAVADFSGHYGSTHGNNLHLNTYLFGPQVSFPARVSPFAHVVFGAAHESISNPGAAFGIANLGTNTAFATAVGAGIDVKPFHFVSLRLFQFDYLMTRFGSKTQNQPRASAGVVLHF
ncbi:MAG: hypothetical protein ACHQLQ_10165 [Candidatus Acidiferrales bacterium]